MHSIPRVILLEFNELSAKLISKFMRKGVLPNFQALYKRSAIFETDAKEEYPYLEPWIQWPTVHSGLEYQDHKIFKLGEGADFVQSYLADVLAENGIRAGLFGSMNVNYRAPLGYFVPDPWHRTSKAFPKELQPFYSVISKKVQESSRDGALQFRDIAELGQFLLSHGLSLKTIGRIFKQLSSEMLDSGVKWRRASVLDHVQYDVFRCVNRRMRVDFATFFSNSVAHYQHYYWRNMSPEIFASQPSTSDHKSYASAIEYGYRNHDAIIGRVLKDYPSSTIMLCTALSQRPWVEGSKCTYRPKSFESLLKFAGIDRATVTLEAVMAEQFHVRFESPAAAALGAEKLKSLTIRSAPVMDVSTEADPTYLFCGCAVFDRIPEGTTIIRSNDLAQADFSSLFYMIHTVRSGRHDPSGLLWISNRPHDVTRKRVSLTAIAPTILSEFKIQPPAHMTGASL